MQRILCTKVGETKMDGRNERKEKKKTNDISEKLPTRLVELLRGCPSASFKGRFTAPH